MAWLRSRMDDPSICMPELQESNEDFWAEYSGDCLANWMQNNEAFFQYQQKKLLTAALEPFLYSVTSFVPQAWLDLLIQCSVLDRKRISSLTPLSEDEHDMLELAEQMFERCAQLVSNKNDVKTILNLIHDVELRPKCFNGVIDIGYIEKEVGSLQIFSSLWAPIRRFYDKKKTQVKVCIAYFFKIMYSQIITYGSDGVDRLDYCKARLLKEQAKCTDGTFDNYNSSGGNAYRQGNYVEAMNCYTKAAHKDPFSPYVFGNRAQTHLNLKDFWSAYWDCKRALIRDPTISKNCYRQARSCIELGWLKEAQDLNEKAMVHCHVDAQKVEIVKQKRMIEAKAKAREERESESSSSKTKSESQNIEYYGEDSSSLWSLFREGCSLYDDRKYKACVEIWSKALAVSSDHGLENPQMSEQDVVVLRLVQGLTLVQTGIFNNLMTALDKLAVLTQSPSLLHPAVFYSLTLAYYKLNRFEEAQKKAASGLKALEKDGYEFDCIPEWLSSNDLLLLINKKEMKKMLISLAEECAHHPKPDAVCRYHQDTHQPRVEIYLTDPDYKGFVRIECSEVCRLEFHWSCWKALKATRPNKSTDKSMLDTQCSTPDCQGFIHSIQVYRSDNERPVEIVSSQPLRAPTQTPKSIKKTKTDNPEKLQKKAEKKQARKQKKFEEKTKASDEVKEEKMEEEKKKKFTVNAQNKEPTVFKGEGTMLMKEDTDEVQQGKSKSSKSKKKKEKAPKNNVIPVDVQFKDDGKLLYGADSVDFDDPSNVPGLLPMPGSAPFPIGNGLLTIPSSVPSPDHLANTLFELFEDILTANGPQFVGSPLIQSIMKDFPTVAMKKIFSYGGLDKFLYSNKKFDVVSGRIVCIKEHSKQAHIMAELFFKQLHGVPFPQQQQFGTMPLPGNAGSVVPSYPPPPFHKPEFSWDQRAKQLAAKMISNSNTAQIERTTSSIMTPDEMPSLQVAMSDKRASHMGSNPQADTIRPTDAMTTTKLATPVGSSSTENTEMCSGKPAMQHQSAGVKVGGLRLLGPFPSVPPPGLDSLAIGTTTGQTSHSEPDKSKHFLERDVKLSTTDILTVTTVGDKLSGERKSSEESSRGQNDCWNETRSTTTSIGDQSSEGSDNAQSVMDNVDDDQSCNVSDADEYDDNSGIGGSGIASLLSNRHQDFNKESSGVLFDKKSGGLLSNLGSLLAGKTKLDSETSFLVSEESSQAVRSGSPALSQGSSESNQSQPPPLKPLKGINILARNKRGKISTAKSKNLTPTSSQSHSSVDSTEGKEDIPGKQQEQEASSSRSSIDFESDSGHFTRNNFGQNIPVTNSTLTSQVKPIVSDSMYYCMEEEMDPVVFGIFNQTMKIEMDNQSQNSSPIQLQSDSVHPINGEGGGEEIASSPDLITKLDALQTLWSETSSEKVIGSNRPAKKDQDWTEKGFTPSFIIPSPISTPATLASSVSSSLSSFSATTSDPRILFPSLHSQSPLDDIMKIDESASNDRHQYQPLSSSSSMSLSLQHFPSIHQDTGSNDFLSSLLNSPTTSSQTQPTLFDSTLWSGEHSKSLISNASSTSSNVNTWSNETSVFEAAVTPHPSGQGHQELRSSLSSQHQGLQNNPGTPTPLSTFLPSQFSSDTHPFSPPSTTSSSSPFNDGTFLNAQVMPFEPGMHQSKTTHDPFTGRHTKSPSQLLSNNSAVNAASSVFSANAPDFNPSAPFSYPTSDTNPLLNTLKGDIFENAYPSSPSLSQVSNSESSSSSVQPLNLSSTLNPNSKEFQPTSSVFGPPLMTLDELSTKADASCQSETVETRSVQVNTSLTGEMFTHVTCVLEQKMKQCKNFENQLEMVRLDMGRLKELQLEQTMNLEETQSNLKLEQERNKVLEDKLQGLKQEMEFVLGQNADLKRQVIDRETMEKERYRAVAAEKKILHIVSQLTSQKLEGKKAEGLKHLKQLELACDRGVLSHQAIGSKQQEWHAFVNQCDQQLDKVQTLFNQQIEQLNQGKLLEDLPALSAMVAIPEMPRPPSWTESTPSPQDDSQAFEVKESVSIGGATAPFSQAINAAAASSVPQASSSKQHRDTQGVKTPPGLKALSMPLSLQRNRVLQLGDSASGLSRSKQQSTAGLPPGISNQPPLQQPDQMATSHLLLQMLKSSHLQQTQQQQQQQQPQQPHQQQQPHHQQLQMTNFEKIVEELQKSFPVLTREVIKTFVEVVRRNNRGTLSNLSTSQVVSHVRELVFGLITKPPEGSQFPLPTSVSKYKTEDIPLVAHAGELDDDYENLCPICHDHMDLKRACKLDCNHVFHEECIRRWFKQQKTCPNCRVYTLLSDEFPSLK